MHSLLRVADLCLKGFTQFAVFKRGATWRMAPPVSCYASPIEYTTLRRAHPGRRSLVQPDDHAREAYHGTQS